MKVFNMRALTRKQRFTKALVFGSLATLACTIILILLWKMFYVYAPLLYIAAGAAIGYSIQYFGKGVQIQFSLLALGLTLLCMIISDFCIMQNFSIILSEITGSLFSIGYRIVALYLAFTYARVI